MASVRALGFLLLGWQFGCGDCDSYGVEPSYLVQVRSADTAESICDAQVFAGTSGGARTTPTYCKYRPLIPKGDALVTMRVEHPDYVTASKEVSTKYKSDRCGHPISPAIDFELERR